MPKKLELPHCGQILTTKAAILDYIRSIDYHVSIDFLYCVAVGREDSEYKIRLFTLCAKLWFLGKMVYRGKDGISKLPAEKYQYLLFHGRLENEEEVADELNQMNLGSVDANSVYQCMQPIELLWCHMISRTREQTFVSELAYAADYVLARNGDVPTPEFETDMAALFPSNYKDFRYWEGDIVEFCDSFWPGI